jgi:hypothetical protein
VRRSAKKTKEDLLTVWTYLRDHPEIEDKLDLPHSIFKRIQNDSHLCPWCEFFISCMTCPSPGNCEDPNQGFLRWHWSKTGSRGETDRYMGASDMVKAIEAWDISKCSTLVKKKA